jgi:hypothetical protein
MPRTLNPISIAFIEESEEPVKKLAQLLIYGFVISILVSPSPVIASTPSKQKTLTICTNLKTGFQLVSKTGKCDTRIYEARTWFRKGSAPSGTPGSKLLNLQTCVNKSSKLQTIRTRAACNSKTQTTASWQRPLGPPA